MSLSTDKVSKDLVDLEPTAVLEFYKLYYDTINEPDSFFPFHPCSNGIEKGINFNGLYHVPVAVEVEDFESNILNRINRPKIRISNVNYIISSLLRRKNDFKFAKLERTKVFVKYIDDSNFEGGVNPFGTPDPNATIAKDTYNVSQKTQENPSLVEFELTAPFDLENFTIPGRLVLGRYCYWQYRGLGCNYFGPLVCQDNDEQFTNIPTGNFNFQTTDNIWTYGKSYKPGDIVYLETDKDPFKTWYVCQRDHTASEYDIPSLDGSPWQSDGCSKIISACRKRFVNTGIYYTGTSGGLQTGVLAFNIVPSTLTANVNTQATYLPFGGFPATDKYSYGASFRNRK